MLEIRTNLYGQIVMKDSDETSGIGTFWNFSVLQEYIKDSKVEKSIVPHLAKLTMREVEDISFINFTKEERDRLEKDLIRSLIRLYYTKELRDFRVEIVDGYFKFYEGDEFIKTITVLRFERDLEDGAKMKKKSDNATLTPKEVAISCINFIFEGRSITQDEIDALSDQMVLAYNNWRIEEDHRLEELAQISKKKR